MKRTFTKLHLFFRDIMPYMVLLVLVLFLVNMAKIGRVEKDINSIRLEIEETRSDVANMHSNSQADNSDVIQAIRAHHKVISQQIDEAERQIKANAIIWSK